MQALAKFFYFYCQNASVNLLSHANIVPSFSPFFFFLIPE